MNYCCLAKKVSVEAFQIASRTRDLLISCNLIIVNVFKVVSDSTCILDGSLCPETTKSCSSCILLSWDCWVLDGSI
jgi:hypothetical protein